MSGRWPVALLFFASGLASLVLETVWVRMMVLVFGSTTFALSTVLTAFMGGLALGSWVAGRRAEGMRDPRRALLVYGVLELAIGAYAFGLPHLVDRIHMVHAAIWGSHASYYSFALLRFLLASALLLVPTAAMGATLPVLARYFCGDDAAPETGAKVGTLYAVNTAGAVVGVFLAGFVLLPRVGMWATNLIACLADLCLACAALLLWRSSSRRAGPTRSGAAAVRGVVATTTVAGPTWLPAFAAASIAVSGALAMVYQVAWNRAMSLIIGSSTYAFSLILICFLIGLAGGAALYARRQAGQPDQAGNLSVVHLLIAATAFGGIMFMDHLPVILVTLLRKVQLAPSTVFLLKFVVAGMVILLPTFFMGMVFPAVLSICARGARGAARTTGDVYAMNTLGSIAGSFAGGFVLVPLVGLQQSLVLMVLAGLLLAALFGVLAASPRARVVLVVASVGASLGVLGLVRPWNLKVMTSGVFRVSRYEGLIGAARNSGEDIPRDEERERRARRRIPVQQVIDTLQEPSAGYDILFHREGITTTVSLTRSVNESLSTAACWVRSALLVNGKPDASLSVLHRSPPGGCKDLLHRPTGPGLRISPSGDAETQILSGLLPVLVHDGDRPPGSMLVIGWGSGITVGAALQAPLSRVVAVELEREVVEAARGFEPYNHRPRADPRLRLVNEDGRNYLAVNPEFYDLVVSEPSNPWIAGCGNLFTREFFRLVHSRLGADGVFLQWLQAYEIAPENVLSILGTLSDVFPSVFVFRPAEAPTDLLLVARKGRRGTLSWPVIEKRLAIPAVRRELGRVRVETPADVVARLLAGPARVRKVTSGVPRNTDDNARIEFATPKDLINYQRYSSRQVARILGIAVPHRRELLRGVPGDFCSRHCWGLLAAGRPQEAVQLGRTAGHCVERAATLLAPLPPVPPEHLASRARGASPAAALRTLLGRRRVPWAVLGHLYALAEEPYPALVYLLGAQETGARYGPLGEVLRAVLYDRGQHEVARDKH